MFSTHKCTIFLKCMKEMGIGFRAISTTLKGGNTAKLAPMGSTKCPTAKLIGNCNTVNSLSPYYPQVP